MSLLQLNALVVGNGSYILWPCGHDLHGLTVVMTILIPFNHYRVSSHSYWVDFRARNESNYCGLHILCIYANHLVLKVQTIPRHFFARKLRKFLANSLVKMFLDFSKFGLSTKSWKLVSTNSTPPPPPHWTWEFGILTNLDSASKVGNWFPPTPPTSLDMGIRYFSKFGLSIKSWKLVSTNTPLPPSPPHHTRHENLGF